MLNFVFQLHVIVQAEVPGVQQEVLLFGFRKGIGQAKAERRR